MNVEKTYKTSEVYGIQRDLPLNYVIRENVDTSLINNLTRDKHIVLFGSSKQGKTSLRKHCLQDEDYIVIQCSNRWTLNDLNAALLKQVGYELSESQTKTEKGFAKTNASLKFSNLGVNWGRNKERSTTSTFRNLELDLSDVNDVINALEGYDKYFVLEDFHYLTVEAQRDFSVALKAFHEKSKICFIIVGVWLEEGRLTVYNGDLTGRIVNINVDKWERAELKEVIEAGESLLNISFHNSFKESLLDHCLESVYLVQEACFQACEKENVYHTSTQDLPPLIGENIDAKDLVKDIVQKQSARYNSFITQVANGFQSTSLEMYKWVLYPILISDASIFENGIKYNKILEIIRSKHPKQQELNAGNLTQALQAMSALQVKKDVKPIVLDYDQTNLKLEVVDKSFMIWLVNQNRNDLLELVQLPLLNE